MNSFRPSERRASRARAVAPVPARPPVALARCLGRVVAQGSLSRESDAKIRVRPQARELTRHVGTALAGHLLEAHVRPTLEIIVRESPVHLCKVKDPANGLALISSEQFNALLMGVAKRRGGKSAERGSQPRQQRSGHASTSVTRPD